MYVSDLLGTKENRLITAQASTLVVEAMGLLLENRISCLPVLDSENELVGILSDRDIFRSVYENRDSFESQRIGDLMTTDLIIGLSSDDISYIAGLMTRNRIRHIPILEDRKLIGLLSVGDLVKIQIKDMEVENRYLKIYIDGSYPG